MDYINVYANAKINLALDIVGKRDNGYHNMKMVMQTLALRDSLFIKKIHTKQIRIVSNLSWLPVDERNLVHKACTVLFDKFKPDCGVFIELNKRIPVSAGLAGGSADCAATLIGIRRLFNFSITNEELSQMGKTLGADVPYCLMRGTALAEGIGDELTRLAHFPNAFVLLAKPNFSVSTPNVFKAYRNDEITDRPDIDTMISSLNTGDLGLICRYMGNVLESVTAKQHPVIYTLKQIMLENGAAGALMSGSGPTVFGIFASMQEANNAYKQVRRVTPMREVYITNIFNPGRNECNER